MKILITPRSFGKCDPLPFELLADCGVEAVTNSSGGIMSESQMIKAITGCDGVIVGVDPLNERVLKAAPALRAVAKYGVGLDNIDMDYCLSRGISVSRTVGANSAAVADYTFALMLALSRKVIQINAHCRQGNWEKITTSDVAGKTIGIVGLGAVGRQMVARAKGFSMKIMSFDILWDDEYARCHQVIHAGIGDICRECDFICLHVPLLPETKNMIGREQIALMKPSAYLINTARGCLVDEVALMDALRGGRIAGAGLDAFQQEPPANREWLEMENVIIGSHCAASTVGASNAMSNMAVVNILADLGISMREGCYAKCRKERPGQCFS
jgi:D-3-phosphoglycerate dehydrogenase